MNKKKFTKLLALYLPYLVIGLAATNFGEAWRLAEGKELGDRIVSLIDTLPAAFANPLPSLHPLDILVGICCGAGLRLAVYLKSKNAKKYRHGMEYGSARWGTPADIAPFMAPKFEDNIILTKTERLMMSNRPPDPKNARNKNVLVVGGSGSGKTRYFIKPNLLQCTSKSHPVSFVVTDPKGGLIQECGLALLKNGYKIRTMNTINFHKSMRYNPFAYIHEEKDILKLVTTLMTNTKGEGQGGDPFWDKAERLLLTSLIAYLHYEAPAEEQNFATLLEMLNTMQVSEDDEDYQNPVDLLFEDLAKKKLRATKSSAHEPDKVQNAGEANVIHSDSGEGGSNWLSRWRQKQDVRKSYYAAARSGGTAAQTAGGQKITSSGASATKSGVEQVIDKGKSAVSTAVNGIANFAKSNAHVLVIVGVFLLLLLLVMSAFSSCSILFSGTTQVSGQTMYSAEDRDIRGAEQDYKKLEKELDKKIKRIPTDHPGYNEYQYHLDAIEHDPWQLTSFLTTLYDDYTRSEVQGKLKETFKKQYKLTTWVEVQIRYKTVWVISPAGIPIPTQVPYEYRIFHTKLVNRGLEVVIREELDNDQWKRYEIFQDTLGGRPYLFNGGLPPGGSDGSGAPGIDYQVPAEALTDSEFAAIYKEAQKYVGTPYVWGGSTPETGFDCSGYVCWVYNQNGYNVGRTTANGLWNKCQHISEAEAKPGDLVFFKGTYDTPGMSHTGIYLGNGMMVSAGDPIKYANIHSSYWQKYLSGFGRLSK